MNGFAGVIADIEYCGTLCEILDDCTTRQRIDGTCAEATPQHQKRARSAKRRRNRLDSAFLNSQNLERGVVGCWPTKRATNGYVLFCHTR